MTEATPPESMAPLIKMPPVVSVLPALMYTAPPRLPAMRKLLMVVLLESVLVFVVGLASFIVALPERVVAVWVV